MVYIHQSSCISHLPTFTEVNLEDLIPSVNNQLAAIEPKYHSIPPGQLRRMGRALRIGVGTSMQLLEKNTVNGILIATANGGIEDSITFLNQIIDYQEGRLTPTNFVQSTFNAIAGLSGMITKNHGYNATHVHRGLAFENALLDTIMLLRENPGHTYLVGGVDEISVRNYRMEALAGWYKKEELSSLDLYTANTPGTLPGEGAAMFIAGSLADNSLAKLQDIKTLHTTDLDLVQQQLKLFLQRNNAETSIDLFLSGESGDSRFQKFYKACELTVQKDASIARFKHAFGEFQTVSALAFWLSVHTLNTQYLPEHFYKRKGPIEKIERILIYNNYQGVQHSFLLLAKA
jgi:hypothetical protein